MRNAIGNSVHATNEDEGVKVFLANMSKVHSREPFDIN